MTKLSSPATEAVPESSTKPISASFSIAPADETALPACFALLPALATREALVFAARDSDGRLAGAGGLAWKSWNHPPGFPGWVHVLPDSRGRGIGRALAETLKRAVEFEPTPAIWAVEPIDAGSDAARFAAACGFARVRSQLYFDTDAPRFLEMTGGIVDRLRQRGRIPAGARLIGIDHVPPGEIARMVAEGLRSSPPRMEELLRRSIGADPRSSPIDRERSFALMMGDELAGALLSRRQPDGINQTVVCNVVDPQWRGGWANALLLHETTRWSVNDGCQRFGFDCGDDVRDTIGLARRGGADHVRTAEFYRYAASASDRD